MDANVKKLKLSYLYEAAVMKIEKKEVSNILKTGV